MKKFNALFLLFFVVLSACTKSYTSKFDQSDGYDQVNSQIKSDPNIDKIISPYKKQLDDKMNRVIGYSAKELPKQRKGVETLLGNFVADLMLVEAQKMTSKKIDLAVVTFGGLRVSVPQGPIKVNDIFELMPFENDLVIITVDKSTMHQLFDYMIEYKNTALANTKLLVENGRVKDVLVGGEPLDKDSYRIAISDYLANGGDGMSFFKNVPVINTKIKLRDAIIMHIESLHQQNQKIDPEIEGRVIIR